MINIIQQDIDKKKEEFLKVANYNPKELKKIRQLSVDDYYFHLLALVKRNES